MAYCTLHGRYDDYGHGAPCYQCGEEARSRANQDDVRRREDEHRQREQHFALLEQQERLADESRAFHDADRGTCTFCGQYFVASTRRRYFVGETWTGALAAYREAGVCPRCYHQRRDLGEVVEWPPERWSQLLEKVGGMANAQTSKADLTDTMAFIDRIVQALLTLSPPDHLPGRLTDIRAIISAKLDRIAERARAEATRVEHEKKEQAKREAEERDRKTLAEQSQRLRRLVALDVTHEAYLEWRTKNGHPALRLLDDQSGGYERLSEVQSAVDRFDEIVFGLRRQRDAAQQAKKAAEVALAREKEDNKSTEADWDRELSSHLMTVGVVSGAVALLCGFSACMNPRGWSFLQFAVIVSIVSVVAHLMLRTDDYKRYKGYERDGRQRISQRHAHLVEVERNLAELTSKLDWLETAE